MVGPGFQSLCFHSFFSDRTGIPFKENEKRSPSGRMALNKIKRDPTDEDFRSKATALIDSAKKKVLVIAGEIGAYGFPDMKWAAERARERGVSVKVYATDPP